MGEISLKPNESGRQSSEREDIGLQKIIITAGETIITAALHDSKAAKDFASEHDNEPLG